MPFCCQKSEELHYMRAWILGSKTLCENMYLRRFEAVMYYVGRWGSGACCLKNFTQWTVWLLLCRTAKRKWEAGHLMALSLRATYPSTKE